MSAGAGSPARQLGALARATVGGRSYVAVGLHPAQLIGITWFGGHVLGDIAVIPAGAPAPTWAGPLLTIRGEARGVFEHVVGGYAAALRAARAEIEGFLAAVDRPERATVVSYFPVPKDIFGRRPVLGADAALALALESKACGALAEALPTAETATLEWPADRRRWRALTAELGAEALVIQAPGAHGGGTGTRIVRGWEEATIRLAGFAPGRLRASKFVDGDPCNVMGLVPAEGPVIALPASRQRIVVDAAGQPTYAGNAIEAADFTADERAAIATEVRRMGEHLRRRGYVGPFGLDFIRASDGRRVYHDLNPRMNGVAGLFAEQVADTLVGDGSAGDTSVGDGSAGDGPAGEASPLPVLLLARPEYSESEASALEEAVLAAALARPRWRLLLSCVAQRPRTIEAPPPSGRWALTLAPLGLRFCGEAGAAAGAELRLSVTLAAGQRTRAGERVMIGDLSCAPALGVRLVADGGLDALARMLLAGTWSEGPVG